MLVIARRVGGALALALGVIAVIVVGITFTGDADLLEKFMQRSPVVWMALSVVMYPISARLFRR